METYRKYYDEERALRYQNRKPRRQVAEMRLIDKAFNLIPSNHRVLDVPCGGGRVMIHLARKGFAVEGADVSPDMVEIAKKNVDREGLNCLVRLEDLEKLSLPDQCFDTTVCFRLFHHFPDREIRQRAVSELCRISKYYVVLSYFTPWAIASVRRKIRTLCGIQRGTREATSLREVKSYFQQSGFRFIKDFAQIPFIPFFHTLNLAVFARNEV